LLGLKTRVMICLYTKT